MDNLLSIKSLFSQFSNRTKDDWIKLANRETKSDQSLIDLSWKDSSGITFQPYYDSSDRIQNPSLFSDKLHNTRAWANWIPLSNDIHEEELLLLNEGADGLYITIDQLQVLLNRYQEWGVDLPTLGIIVRKDDHKAVVTKLLDQLQETQVFFFQETETILWQHPGIYVPASNNPLDEIVYALHQGVKQLENLITDPNARNELFKKSCFSLASSKHFFATLAKSKALRQLWFQIVRAYGVTDYNPNDLFIHIRVPTLKPDSYPPQGSLIHAPALALASILGKADAITVYPEDFSPSTSRVAKNVSLVLREEGHLNQFSDALTGAYFVDKLIDQYAQLAWKNFQNQIKSQASS